MEIFTILERVQDPRRDHLKEHSLECLFYITIAAVLGGAESWYEVAEFGRMREDFFRTRIKDFRGVPSHDTFNRVFPCWIPSNWKRVSAYGSVRYAAGTVASSALTARRFAVPARSVRTEVSIHYA